MSCLSRWGFELMTQANANRSDAVPPFFIATERFDTAGGEKWEKYCEWAKIPGLTEVVSLDCMLCSHIVTDHHLDYVKQKTQDVCRKNILGVYRNPETHIAAPPAKDFRFVGHDLIEELTQISALTNCGGFPDVFQNGELNSFGLIEAFDRACEIKRQLLERHPEEPHADCELYAVWRLEQA